jgi:hypothetical protein
MASANVRTQTTQESNNNQINTSTVNNTTTQVAGLTGAAAAQTVIGLAETNESEFNTAANLLEYVADAASNSKNTTVVTGGLDSNLINNLAGIATVIGGVILLLGFLERR